VSEEKKKKEEIPCPATVKDWEEIRDLIWEAGDATWGHDLKGAGEFLGELARYIDEKIKKCVLAAKKK